MGLVVKADRGTEAVDRGVRKGVSGLVKALAMVGITDTAEAAADIWIHLDAADGSGEIVIPGDWVSGDWVPGTLTVRLTVNPSPGARLHLRLPVAVPLRRGNHFSFHILHSRFTHYFRKIIPRW